MIEIKSELLEKFSRSRILVVGDLMLDESLLGHIERISPEAPVPILNLVRRGYALGGAGNVVRNLRTLGAKVVVLGVVGEDSTGRHILRLLDQLGVDGQGVLRDPGRRSSRKTRMISMEHGQQVFRLDEESTHPLDQAQECELLTRLEAILPDVNAVLCSDYLKGVLTERVLQETFRLAKNRGLQVTVAPKDSNRNKYHGAGILMLNAVELARLAAAARYENGWQTAAACNLINEMGIEALLVTRGCEGMSLFERAHGEVQQVDIPTMAQSVYDVTGAGDTAVSVFTLSVAAGADRETAARVANIAAGIVVGKPGTASVTIQEIQDWMREFRGLPAESRVAAHPSQAALGPLDLAAPPERLKTGISAND